MQGWSPVYLSRRLQVSDVLQQSLQFEIFLFGIMMNRPRFVTSRQHLTHQFITSFDNEVGMPSYANAFHTFVNTITGARKKLKVKEEPTCNLSAIKRID